VSDACVWGVFREHEHSPGRESDDAEILRLTGKQLEARGLQVILRSAEDVLSTDAARPIGIFLMCERRGILRHLEGLEARGIPHVNSPHAVLNTYRERMIDQLREAAVPFIESDVVRTDALPGAVTLPLWVKRADVHNTQEGDVVFVEDREHLEHALHGLARRDIHRAILQPPIEGDLVKFYGIGAGRDGNGGPPWFRWFYHKDQRVAGHAFDASAFARTVRRAATALGLDVYGGDAIVTSTSDVVLLDLNAWPSFALYRDEAAERIAAHLWLRFRGMTS
jgi:hypothetical protein